MPHKNPKLIWPFVQFPRASYIKEMNNDALLLLIKMQAFAKDQNKKYEFLKLLGLFRIIFFSILSRILLAMLHLDHNKAAVSNYLFWSNLRHQG